MSNETPPIPDPAADLKLLEGLVGTWKLTGGAEGTIRYEWMEGGHFLLQHVDLVQDGQTIKGLEVIGHNRRFMEETDTDIRSRFFDNAGNTLDYTYEPLDEDTVKIWAGDKGSPAYAVSKMSKDGKTLSAEWVYPGGGGYRTEGTRVA
jgi:hypothetical protein